MQISGRYITAEISPDVPGFVRSLCFLGKEILWSAPERNDPIEAGGIPLLFPFPGTTAGGCWRYGGASYPMPVHGFLKELPLRVTAWNGRSIRMLAEPGKRELAAYPFEFQLNIRCRVEKMTFQMHFQLENRSGKTMPYALGIHPYFRMTDAASARLCLHADCEQDYLQGRMLSAPPDVVLTEPTDRVLCALETPAFVLENPTDGYRFTCRFDETFDTLTVYNGEPGAVCVEPWTSLVNTANTGARMLYLRPGQTVNHFISIAFEP